MIKEMSLFHRQAHKRHRRSDSFHQKQVRFFCILFVLLAALFIAGMLMLISRSPASAPLIH
jgi:hypothetical protein